MTGASGRQRAELDYIKNVPVPSHSLQTQKKIASILSVYDDLIENNNKRIKILEEMAQNIYKEWFVKFRYPGHENVKMVDSELGKIPERWEVKELGELIHQVVDNRGKTPPLSNFGHELIGVLAT